MRHLAWDGCVNVRDLGGLPTADGGATRSGLVVRADDIGALTADGWLALAGYGVRTAVDLRFAEERSPHPPHAVPIAVEEIPLFGRLDRFTSDRLDGLVVAAEDAAAALAILYVDALEVHGTRIAQAVDTVARALDEGAVVVHCAIGKDRTGIVSALLLRLAGVPADVVADDYALSHERVSSLVGTWIAQAEDGAQHEYRSRMCAAPREGMAGMLDVLEERYDGAERYLLDAGVAADRIACLRTLLAG